MVESFVYEVGKQSKVSNEMSISHLFVCNYAVV